MSFPAALLVRLEDIRKAYPRKDQDYIFSQIYAIKLEQPEVNTIELYCAIVKNNTLWPIYNYLQDNHLVYVEYLQIALEILFQITNPKNTYQLEQVFNRVFSGLIDCYTHTSLVIRNRKRLKEHLYDDVLVTIRELRAASLEIWRMLIASGFFTDKIQELFSKEQAIREQEPDRVKIKNLVDGRDFYLTKLNKNSSNCLMRVSHTIETYRDTEQKVLESRFIHTRYLDAFLNVYQIEQSCGKSARKV